MAILNREEAQAAVAVVRAAAASNTAVTVWLRDEAIYVDVKKDGQVIVEHIHDMSPRCFSSVEEFLKAYA